MEQILLRLEARSFTLEQQAVTLARVHTHSVTLGQDVDLREEGSGTSGTRARVVPARLRKEKLPVRKYLGCAGTSDSIRIQIARER